MEEKSILDHVMWWGIELLMAACIFPGIKGYEEEVYFHMFKAVWAILLWMHETYA